jgi:hypothetical protein
MRHIDRNSADPSFTGFNAHAFYFDDENTIGPFIHPEHKDENIYTEKKESEEKVEEALSPETEMNIRNFSRSWIESIFEVEETDIGEFPTEIYEQRKDFYRSIAVMAGVQKDYDKGFLPKVYRDGMNIFIQDLLHFISEKSEDNLQGTQLKKFIEYMSTLFFSISPNISNEIGFGNLLLATTKANRIPEVQGWFGQTMVGEMVYELNWCSEKDISTLEALIMRQPSADALDILNQLETLGANAVAQGWADKALQKINQITTYIKENANKPILKYAADITLNHLASEEIDPSLGVITFAGNKAAGRLSETLSRKLEIESYQLESLIKPDVVVPPGGKIIRTSSDTVSILDHSALPRYFAKIDLATLSHQYSEGADNLLSLHFMSYELISKNRDLNPFAHTEDGQFALLLRHLHRPELRAKIEEDLMIDFSELEFGSQIHLLKFLSEADERSMRDFRNFLRGYQGRLYEQTPADFPDWSQFKKQFLQAFLVVGEDLKYGSDLLDLVFRIDDCGNGIRIFSAYNQFATKAKEQAKKVCAEMQKDNPDLEFGEDVVLQALLKRGKDYILELKQEAMYAAEDEAYLDEMSDRSGGLVIDRYIKELENSSAELNVTRAEFRDIANLLDVGTNVDLQNYSQRQELVLRKMIESPEIKIMAFQALQRMERLVPIPEIHWRVDRSMDEYSRRLGLNIPAYLLSRSIKHSSKQILLEIGPGSGVAKEERVKLGLTNNYQEYSLSDKIYYPIAGVIEKLLDFETIEDKIGESLNDSDRKALVDIIYKTIQIEHGQTGQENFEMDRYIKYILDYSPNNLKRIFQDVSEEWLLSTASQRLSVVESVPSNISSRDQNGKVNYPNKLRIADFSPSIQKAIKLLSASFSVCLRKDWEDLDYLSLVDAFTANTIIGDIKDVSKLKDNQVDVELAVRSTVYCRGDEYVQFLIDLQNKLTDGGIALDDSIRDNDGWYYRIAEVVKAKSKMDQDAQIFVILGPGFDKEDFRIDRVPLSMIMAKGKQAVEDIQQSVKEYLQPGCSIVKIEDLAADHEYLKSLDNTGMTLKKIADIQLPGSGNRI